jgi:ATP-dependent helicase/nuclease subunit A
LAETNREFRFGSQTGDCITDGQATIGLKIIDHNSSTKLPSLAWQVISQRQKKQDIAEEMRILYVAMTRAKDKLILSGAAESKNCVRLLSNGALCGSARPSSPKSGNLPSWLIEEAKSELDWVLLSLAPYKKLNAHFELPVEVDCRDENLFDLKIYRPDEIAQLERQLLKKRSISRYEEIKSPVPDKAILEDITKNLSWQYPFKKAAAIKAKQSVTSLVQTQEQFAEADYSFSFESFEKLTDRTDSLVIGSATHLIIQNMNLNSPVGEDSIRWTIAGLLEKGCIMEQTAEKIDTASILKFFDSALGRLVQDGKNTVMREWPFTYAVSAVDLYPDLQNCGDEKIIIQGIIDMVVKTPDGIVIIDFKTDHISFAQLQQKSEHYSPQLKWYCRAAGEILKAEVVSGYLYFLAVGVPVKIF